MKSLSGVYRSSGDSSNPSYSPIEAKGPGRGTGEGAIRRLLRSRFVRFLLVGGLNTAFSYALFAVCLLIGMAYPIAAFLATVISILFNFKSYGRLVFGSRDSSGILRFFSVYALIYGIGVLLLRIAHAHDLSLFVAAAVFAPPMAVLSFTLNRIFVFHRRK